MIPNTPLVDYETDRVLEKLSGNLFYLISKSILRYEAEIVVIQDFIIKIKMALMV